MAKHNIENMVVISSKLGSKDIIKNYSSNPATKYAPMLQKTALRRSALKGRNSPKDFTLAKKHLAPESESDTNASLKLGGIRGVTKDINPSFAKRYHAMTQAQKHDQTTSVMSINNQSPSPSNKDVETMKAISILKEMEGGGMNNLTETRTLLTPHDETQADDLPSSAGEYETRNEQKTI